jgi:hypothetical protein
MSSRLPACAPARGQHEHELTGSNVPDPDAYKPTVIHHAESRAAAAPPHSASQRLTLANASQLKLNPTRLSESLMQDTRRQMRRGERSGWDVGERPGHAMAFFEFPSRTPSRIRQREKLDFSSAPVRQAHMKHEVRQQRLDRGARRGWHSTPTLPYAPLGEMRSDVQPLDFLLGRHGGITVVEPEADRLATLEGAYKPTMINVQWRGGTAKGPALQGVVSKHGYSYFCIDKPEGKLLRVEVQTLKGDPDLYVCNKNRAPTHAEHTWRANQSGDDIVEIDPDDPDALAGRYFIGVFGVQDTSFILHTHLTPKQVILPRTPANFRTKGFANVKREIKESIWRTRAVAHGASMLEDLSGLSERERAMVYDSPEAAGSAWAPGGLLAKPPATPSASAEQPRRRLEVQWQPPPGVEWSDLPRETRLRLAAGEYIESKHALEARLQRQLEAVEKNRPAKYHRRMQKAMSGQIHYDPHCGRMHFTSPTRREPALRDSMHSRASTHMSAATARSFGTSRSPPPSRPSTSFS